MLDGMQLPISTQAMMITESLNDIKELIDALGGRKTTILSFAGFGDLLFGTAVRQPVYFGRHRDRPRDLFLLQFQYESEAGL